MLSSANTIETTHSFAPVQLLAQIADDHAFRERLESDPIAAFAELGVELDASQLPAEVKLPEMGVLLSSADSIPMPSDPTPVQWNGFFGC